ncbi:Ail/Lom family outer membrane beta-barrel protein [Erwinia persicina]|uniref:Ail/Lom family outer membrane beta-barrel protein n=1 Tax=Erwinia persicina TaxID=55211 RepID=UPI001780AF91|nr:Ail/Lom family outer membrane beta-barrel protein [Erwinia persicina]MBD8214436.1 Ail/Lom family outer membrane beta-barrel protein [Erwinia persicina]
MRKIVTTLLFVSPLVGAAESGPVVEPASQHYYHADTISWQPKAMSGLHTVTLGYAQSHIKHFKNMKGINARYRFEIPELPLSAMVSFSAMNARGSQPEGEGGGIKNHRVRYYSLMVGPAYRVTSWASLYLLGGAGWESSSNVTTYDTPPGGQTGRYKIFDARFAWGTGVQFNLIDNLALDVGYQAGHVQKTSSNGFSLGIGYRF